MKKNIDQDNKRNILFEISVWILIFENTSNANLLDAFYR